MSEFVAGSRPATNSRRLTSDFGRRVSIGTPAEEDPLDTLSPRDIQSRLRTGATVAELAEETGMAVGAIERFSGPPLAERGYVSDQARKCVVRPGTDDLETLVMRDVADRDMSTLAWDAWRREDGRWTVVASTADDTRASTWIYDPRSRSVHPEDPVAHRLASSDVVVPLRSTTATMTLIPDSRATKVVADSAPADEAVAHPPAVADVPVESEADAESHSETDAAAKAAADAPKSRKSRRASVPRWDEILFGASQNET